MMNTATTKTNTHTSTNRAGKKKLRRRKLPKELCGTDREVRTARRHTYDCLAGCLAGWLADWLAGWLAGSLPFLQALFHQLTGQLRDVTGRLSEFIIFSVFFCSLFKLAYEWLNKLTAVVVCSFGLELLFTLPISFANIQKKWTEIQRHTVVVVTSDGR